MRYQISIDNGKWTPIRLLKNEWIFSSVVYVDEMVVWLKCIMYNIYLEFDFRVWRQQQLRFNEDEWVVL